MGTFHHDKGELHGITVVVDTNGAEIYVGRCDTLTEEGIILLDADLHQEGEAGDSKQAFVERVAKFGHWNRHPRVEIASSQIASVRRLGEIPTG